jgi:uncharacterized membrane-anchored protein
MSVMGLDMGQDRIDKLLEAAITQGLLPATAKSPVPDSRPWPVVLLTGLGAWFAALPLLGVVGLLFGDFISRGAGVYIVGVLVLAAAIVVLRSRDLPLFVEQLAIPALLVGGGALGFGLFRDLHSQAGAALLVLIAIGVAAAISQAWLRVLLGAAAAALMAVACMPERWSGSQHERFWAAWHLGLGLWLLAGWVQHKALNDGARARMAAMLESLAAGWLLATLAGLAWLSGMTFLVGGAMGDGFGGAPGQRPLPASQPSLQQAASLILALAAALRLGLCWPTLRSAWDAGLAIVLAALAWFMPTLGAVLLALAFCVTTARWRLAAAAALAAAWIVGAFYYQLQWALHTKALVLIVCGALLGGLAWLASLAGDRPGLLPTMTAGPPTASGPRWAIASTALLVLAVANIGIWQKQDLIAHGQPVYVELAPVDPRSLMQGDFMRLNFRLPDAVQTETDGLLRAERPRVVARRDARNVATLLRIDRGAPLAADELRIELTPKDGRWILVSDAWFFKEGEAERWAAAKYGEFRVDSRGRALLVGLRGATLDAL